ncbi:MAG: Two-component system response regulator DccR [uncultured Sulfurovum sp.]|uniref:Two-component system response regulator DccR n=1 Tax=uncultured Sulfurovum sp. TaxID=269237 RepID=A0A6S6SKG1_9BACT|nr:MAG: Two-component system response regulator DccR [uncultured Sulfurovum sp.]
MKILLLEDDLMLSEVIVEHLEAYHYNVTTVYDGVEAEDLLFEEKFDLLLLDVNVPLLNGFELLKSLRALGNSTPAIFITSMNSSEDVSEGFELGANDYLKKPFEMIELKARIDNIKRQFKIDASDVFIISPRISYDLARHILQVDNKEIKLSKKEGEFLAYFLKHRGEVLSSDTLMVNVWSYDTAPSSATLRTYIKTLRKHLGEGVISTIRGVGYVFN